jgi:hypothetical protein
MMSSSAVETPFRDRPSPLSDTRVGESRFCCNICLEAVVEPVATQCGHLYCWPCLYRWLEPGMTGEERAGLTGRVPLHSQAINQSRRVCPVCKAPCSVPTLVPIYIRSDEPTPINAGESASGDYVERETTESVDTTGDTELSANLSADSSSFEEPDPAASNNNDNTNEMECAHTGLRQRLRFRSHDSEISNNDVPSRPAAMSPPRPLPTNVVPSTPPPLQQQQHFRNQNPAWLTPLSHTAHRASLSHGLLLSFQQAIGDNSTYLSSSQSAVPPLHRRDGGAAPINETELEEIPDATEYLSRLLIMLGSFVILCLLLL